MTVVDDLGRVVAALVSNPEAVRVELDDRGPSIRLDVHLDPRDLGAVIGRRGRTVNALRTLLGLRGQRHGERYDLRVIEVE